MITGVTDTSDPNAEWSGSRDTAIPKLLDLHGSKLYHLSEKICGNADEAEDLVQEVFLQAWRKWHQFRGESSPFVWLYTIARRICQRMHTRRSHEPDRIESLEELLPVSESEVPVLPASDPRADQISREHQEVAELAIAGLPADFRMALVLKEVVGFSVAETAEVLGIPVQTVKTRVHRARLKIKQAIEEGFERVEAPDYAYPVQVCIDLLNARQDALDRGADMPNADGIICERCRIVFSSLDYATRVTRSLRSSVQLPPPLRAALLKAMAVH